MRNGITLALTAAMALGAYAGQALGQQQPQQPEGPARLTVAEKEPFGRFVADEEGRSLYMFTADQRGQGEQKATSACEGPCLEAWPPLLTQGEPEAAEGLQQDLLATIERPDGGNQVTYGGWPLYYFVQDQGPGQVTGQDKQGFGGEWYLVAPGGDAIRTEATAEVPAGGERREGQTQ